MTSLNTAEHCETPQDIRSHCRKIQGRQQLTIIQGQTYDFMVKFYRKNDHLPSTRNIRDHFGLKSQTGAQAKVSVLRRKGYIEHSEIPGKHRFCRPIISDILRR